MTAEPERALEQASTQRQARRRRVVLRQGLLTLAGVPLGARLLVAPEAWAQGLPTTIFAGSTTLLTSVAVTTLLTSSAVTTLLTSVPVTTLVTTVPAGTTLVTTSSTALVVTTAIDPNATSFTLTTLGAGPSNGAAVPEPGSAALLAAGIAGMAALGARLRARLRGRPDEDAAPPRDVV